MLDRQFAATTSAVSPSTSHAFFFFPSRDFLEYLRQKNITKPNKKFSADIVCFRSWGCLIPWQRSDPLNASVAEPKLKWNAVGLGIRRA